MVLHIFFLWLARHRREDGSLSQVQCPPDRSEEIFLQIAEGRSGDFYSTKGASLTRENCVSFPINGFHREMHFHFDRGRSPWAVD